MGRSFAHVSSLSLVERLQVLKVGDRLPEIELSCRDASRRGWVDPWISSRQLHRSRATLLIFVTRSCPTCHWAMEFFERLFVGTRGPAVAVSLVVQEDAESAAAMVQEHALTIPILLDRAPYRAGEALHLRSVPTGILVDGQGRIEERFESFERETLMKMNRRLAGLSGRDPVSPFGQDESVPAFLPG